MRIDAIYADLHEVWISEYRTMGSMHASGRLEISDGFDVRDAKVSLKEGIVQVGARTAMTQSKCDISGEVGPFPAQGTELASVFRSLTAQAKWHSPNSSETPPFDRWASACCPSGKPRQPSPSM